MRTRASATGSGSSPASLDIKKGGDVWNGTKGALYSYGTHKDTENRATCTRPATSSCTGNEHAIGENGLLSGSGDRSGRRQ